MNTNTTELIGSILSIVAVIVFVIKYNDYIDVFLVASITGALVATFTAIRLFREEKKINDLKQKKDAPYIKNVEQNLDMLFNKVDHSSEANAEGRDKIILPNDQTIVISSDTNHIEYGELIDPILNKNVRLSHINSLLGRSESCDITVIDPTVSRFHANLKVMYNTQVDSYYLGIQDLNSANGTYVDNIKVQTDSFTLVEDGATIMLGRYKLYYHQYSWFEDAAKKLFERKDTSLDTNTINSDYSVNDTTSV